MHSPRPRLLLAHCKKRSSSQINLKVRNIFCRLKLTKGIICRATRNLSRPLLGCLNIGSIWLQRLYWFHVGSGPLSAHLSSKNIVVTKQPPASRPRNGSWPFRKCEMKTLGAMNTSALDSLGLPSQSSMKIEGILVCYVIDAWEVQID